MGYSAAHLLQIWFVRTVSVVAGCATERGLQSAGVLVSEGRVGILRARLCVLTFLRDESRAPAAILVGALNTYRGEGNPGVVHPTVSSVSSSAKYLPTNPMVRAMVISTADAEADNRPWRREYDHWGRTHTNRRGVNDDRRGLHVNRRRRVPGRGLISVNGRRFDRTGDDGPGDHTRQNFSRSGPLAVTGSGVLQAAHQERCRRQSRNQRLHKIPFVISAYVHC